MFRRTAALIAVAVSLLAPAGALAAETSTSRLEGSVITAYFSNLPDGDWPPPAGSYFSTGLFAASVVNTGSGEPDYNYICVFSDAFVIDESGGETDWTGFGTCGDVTILTVDRRLNAGRLVASLPVSDCLAWDDETGECAEPVELGTIDVDLTFAGIGAVERQRGTSTGGTAGSWSYAWHGVGTSRAADPSGTLTLDGTSLIDGAVTVSAWMGRVQEGYVAVEVGG